MKKIYTLVAALSLTCTAAVAQNIVDCSASDAWVGYMNVFKLPVDGGGYEFGSAWEVSALKTELNETDDQIILHPNFNTYGDNPTDPFWVIIETGEGNKDLEASTYVEPGGTFNGVDLTFKGSVIANTLDTNYTASFFIKALDPGAGYSDALGGAKIFELPASGAFSVSATGAELAPGLIVQYGFIVRGTNANPANEAALGSVVIGSISLGNETIETLPTVGVYPNPANDLLSFTMNEPVASYQVLDIAGAVVLNGANESSIDVSTLVAGTYFVQVNYLDSVQTIKFVKK
jgi:hypothetical protein